MMLCWKRQLKMISQWTPRLMTWRSWCFHLVNCHRKTGVSDEFLPPKFLFASHWTNKISVVFKHLINLQLAGIRRKYYLWGVFRAKKRSRPNIPTLTANFIAQSSSTQNAAQSLMSPLSVLEGVNSREDLASPLSSCSNSISTKDSPDMLNAKKQDVEQQHDKCRIQTACDIYVSTQGEKLSLICNKGVMFITVQPSFGYK